MKTMRSPNILKTYFHSWYHWMLEEGYLFFHPTIRQIAHINNQANSTGSGVSLAHGWFNINLFALTF